MWSGFKCIHHGVQCILQLQTQIVIFMPESEGPGDNAPLNQAFRLLGFCSVRPLPGVGTSALSVITPVVRA